MKSRTIVFIFTVASMISSAFSQASQGRVLIRLNAKEAGLKIQQLPGSIDIAGQNIEEGTIDIVGSPEYFELLRNEGYPVEIAEYQPEAIDSRYMNPQKIRVFLQELQTRFPDLVHIEEIGKSLRGNSIWGVRLSTKENLSQKPAILFNAMHHAREIMTPEVAVDILIYLVKNYENPATPQVSHWLNHLAIWVVPQVNPDGNEIVWSEDNWWRKNARGDSNGSIWGVDLNRNYPYAWGTCRGSSGNKGDQTYRGESPASEPETRALMNFVKEKNIAIDVSYHSYSELVIAPYGCQNHYTPEDAIVKSVGTEFSKLLKTSNGRGSYRYGTGWEILYPVDGDDISWMYQEVNTLAYVVELNSSSQGGFHPDYEKWRNKTVEDQRPGWQFLLNRLLKGPQIRGRILDAKSGNPVDGEIVIANVRYKDEKPRRAKGGFYQKLLIPGSYELIFSAPGYQKQTLAFSVDQEPVFQDVHLEPGLDLDDWAIEESQ